MAGSRAFAPVKIGVIGLGRFGQLHARTLAGLAEADLVGVVARWQASLDQLSTKLPGVAGWLDIDQAIAESNAEAWVVACSTSDHVFVARKLLQAGQTVLLEKPISEHLLEAESLAPLVSADSSNLMLGHIVLFNSEFKQLRDEVKRRGRPVFIDCVPTSTRIDRQRSCRRKSAPRHHDPRFVCNSGADEPRGAELVSAQISSDREWRGGPCTRPDQLA